MARLVAGNCLPFNCIQYSPLFLEASDLAEYSSVKIGAGNVCAVGPAR